MPFVNDPGDWSQTLEAVAEEHAQIQLDLSRCRCPKCDRFGVISSADGYYGTSYRCSCLSIRWAISPETGEKCRRRMDHYNITCLYV